MAISIRLETPADYRAVEELTKRASWNVNTLGCKEHYVLHLLREDNAFVPELSLVAEDFGSVVGHIAASRATVEDQEGKPHEVLCIGPLSVDPVAQGAGVGSDLMKRCLELAAEMGFCGAFLFGDPRYYTRFGFRPAERYGVCDSEGAFAVALMGIPLTENGLKDIRGRFVESSCFSNVADEAYAEFDSDFPQFQRGYRKSQSDFAVLSTLRYFG